MLKRAILTCCFCTVAAFSKPTDELPIDDPVAIEMDLCLRAKKELTLGHDAAAAAMLLVASAINVSAPEETGSRLAQRTLMICGWLRAENNPRGAYRIAKIVETLLNISAARNKVRGVERAYWEASLLAEFLERRSDALAIVVASRAKDPADERLLELELELRNALAAGGK